MATPPAAPPDEAVGAERVLQVAPERLHLVGQAVTGRDARQLHSSSINGEDAGQGLPVGGEGGGTDHEAMAVRRQV